MPKSIIINLAEFDFRYNERDIDDLSRSTIALKGIVGKRLLYKQPSNT